MYSRYQKTVAGWMIDHQGEYPNRDDLRTAAVEVRGTTTKFASATIRQLEMDGELRSEGYASAAAPAPGPIVPPAEDTTPSISIDDFREQFDLRVAIRSGISRLVPGKIYPDQAFRGFCGISSTADWRRFADMAEFASARLRVRGVLHWAHPETIREMRTIIGG